MEAFTTFRGLVDQLDKHKSPAEAVDFVKAADKVLTYISQKPMMFRSTNKENLREAFVFHSLFLVYKIHPQYVSVISFYKIKGSREREETVIYLS